MEEKKIEELSNKELVHEVGMRTIGTGAGVKSQEAQAELTKRLIDSINNLNKETSHYSQKLMDLTWILFIVGFLQLFITIKSITGTMAEWLEVCILVVGVFLLLVRDYFKDKNK